MKRTCKEASKILAISYDGAKEIHNYVGVDESKIETIYIGKRMFETDLTVDESQCFECLNKYGVQSKNYILFVGTLSPRKNADVIIKGYFEYRRSGGDKKLLIAGKVASRSSNVHQMIAESQFDKDVVLTGYISDEEKRIFITLRQ